MLNSYMGMLLLTDAAPTYSTFDPGRMYMSSTPPSAAAASLLRKGFQTRYSVET
jgi:hypothetical protein